MRIGTYNVLGLTGYPPGEAEKQLGGPDTERTADHFQHVFEDLACDILALQEGVALTQIQRIALGMGVNVATFPSPIAWSGHLLTRYPILESRTYSHPTPDAAQRPFSRTAGAALLSLDDDHGLWVVVLHLHPGQIELRNQEADFITEKVAAFDAGPHPVVVLGDLNCEVEERLHHHLKDIGFVNTMETAGGGLQSTIDTAGLERTWIIDHIYVSADLQKSLANAEVIRREGFRHDGPQEEGVWVHSDHLPVVATLSYP